MTTAAVQGIAPKISGGGSHGFDYPHEEFLSRLRGRGNLVRQVGPSQWEAQCPAHDDRDPSLRVGIGDQGQTLLCCFVCGGPGKNSAKIVAPSVGMSEADLFPRKARERASRARIPRIKRDDLQDAIEDVARALDGEFISKHPYREADGSVRFVIARFHTPDGKELRPFRLGPDGRWKVGGQGKNPPPAPVYRLPDLEGADVVYVFEGEKCADLAASIGLAATTCHHGGWGRGKTDLTPLAGKRVVIVPDNDKPGERNMDGLRRQLLRMSVPALPIVVRLPGLADKGDDIEQWLEKQDGTLDEIRAAFLDVVRQTEADAARGVIHPRDMGRHRKHCRDAAVRWLIGLPWDRPIRSAEMRAMVKAEGFAWRTFERAVLVAGIESVQRYEPARGWYRQPIGGLHPRVNPPVDAVSPPLSSLSPPIVVSPPPQSATPKSIHGQGNDLLEAGVWVDAEGEENEDDAWVEPEGGPTACVEVEPEPVACLTPSRWMDPRPVRPRLATLDDWPEEVEASSAPDWSLWRSRMDALGPVAAS